MNYCTYPEYKDSGVEQLGEVPKGWEIKQLKRTIESCVNGVWGGEPENEGADTIVLRVADFNRQKLSINNDGYTYRKIEVKDKTRRQLQSGDLLIEKSGGGEKTLVGQVVLFNKEFEAVTSNFVAKMTPVSGVDSSFLNYVFARFYSSKINYCSIKQNTGIQNLDSAQYLSEKFAFPRIQEQTQIAAFLDKETAKIDTLIEKQEKLIKLLQEKRQAVISHAVTKGLPASLRSAQAGLNPDVKMKDSGVKWLGEVPKHWEIKKAKYLFSFITSGSRGWAQYYSDNGSLFFRIANLTRDSINPKLDSLQNVTPPRGVEGDRAKIKINDLLISITADLGSICVADEAIADGYVSQHIALCRPTKSVKSSRWLGYVVIADSSKEQLLQAGYGGTKVQLSLDDIRDFTVPVPPYAERNEIAIHVDKQLDVFSKIMRKAANSVSLLNLNYS